MPAASQSPNQHHLHFYSPDAVLLPIQSIPSNLSGQIPSRGSCYLSIYHHASPPPLLHITHLANTTSLHGLARRALIARLIGSSNHSCSMKATADMAGSVCASELHCEAAPVERDRYMTCSWLGPISSSGMP